MNEWNDEDASAPFPHADRCRHCGGSAGPAGPAGHKHWCTLDDAQAWADEHLNGRA